MKELQGKVTELTGNLTATKEKYENQIAQMQFDSVLDGAIVAAGGKNAKAIKALLDVETLMKSKDQTADVKAAVEACQQENTYLFGSDEPINNPVGRTGGDPSPITRDPDKMTYEEYKAWRNGGE